MSNEPRTGLCKDALRLSAAEGVEGVERSRKTHKIICLSVTPLVGVLTLEAYAVTSTTDMWIGEGAITVNRYGTVLKKSR